MPLCIFSDEQAFGNMRSNRNTRWPDGRKSTEGRLGLYAKVGIKPTFSLVVGEPILTIGSCFAREVEKKLVALGFDVPLTKVVIPPEERISDAVNDILNKYIPQAMANELRWAFDPSAEFPEDAYLQVSDELWHDPHLAANLLPASLERVKERRKIVIDAYRSAIQSRIIVITLGLAEAWFDKTTNLYLNATPPAEAVKRYPGRFEFHLLSYEDVMASLEDIHDVLTKFGNPDFKILLTVSPVPFKATFSGADALQANTYSKAVLRAAAEAFVIKHDNVDYFPSFETVTLGDRVACYNIDNIHVKEEVVSKIMNQVVKEYAGLEVNDVSAKPEVEKPKEQTATALYKYANELARVKRYEEASQVMRNIDETYGDSASEIPRSDFHLNFGVWLLRAKQTAAGEAEVRKATLLDPDNHRAHYKKGLALARLKRSEDALQAFTDALRLNPQSAEYNWRYGVELSRTGSMEAAREQFEKALELDPNYEGAQSALRELDAIVKA